MMSPEAAADTKKPARPRRGRVLRALLKVIGAAGLTVGLYGLAGYYGGPWLIDRWLAQYRDAPAGRTASRDSVRFNPFTLVAEIGGIELRDPEAGSGFTADSIVVDFAGASLRKRSPVVSTLAIEAPRIELGEAADLAGLTRHAPIPGLESARIEDLSVRNGQLVVGPYDVLHFDLSIAGFDSAAGAAGRFEMDADMENGTRLSGSGRVEADLARVEGQLDAGGGGGDER